MNFTRLYLTALLGLVLVGSGCAHPIQITPDMTRLERVSTTSDRLAVKAGYYIPPEVASVEITTQGGGGDNVRYYPYRDMALGFQKMLSNVFEDVVKLASPADKSVLVRDGINYVIVPSVATSSGGSGFFTWPPTNFSVDLTSQIRNTDGKLIASPRVIGTGSADTGERLSEHGIAGSRAMEDALMKMQLALFETNFHDPVQSSSPAVKSSIAERLANIKELKDSGLITEQEYNVKRKEFLKSL